MLHDTEIIELGPECRERYFCGDVYPLLDTLGVPVAGYSELQGHYRVQRCGAEHLLAVSLYGCGEGGPADSPWRMEAGSLLLVPAGQAYVQRTLGGARWHSAWALLQPAQWPNFPAHAQVLRAEGGADLAPLMDLLHQERFRCDPAATELRRSLCESLVAVLQRLLRGSRPEGAAHAGLQSLFAAVAAEPAQAWSLEQLSGPPGLLTQPIAPTLRGPVRPQPGRPGAGPAPAAGALLAAQHPAAAQGDRRAPGLRQCLSLLRRLQARARLRAERLPQGMSKGESTRPS